MVKIYSESHCTIIEDIHTYIFMSIYIFLYILTLHTTIMMMATKHFHKGGYEEPTKGNYDDDDDDSVYTTKFNKCMQFSLL